jgi:hypothetical protein
MIAYASGIAAAQACRRVAEAESTAEQPSAEKSRVPASGDSPRLLAQGYKLYRRQPQSAAERPPNITIGTLDHETFSKT